MTRKVMSLVIHDACMACEVLGSELIAGKLRPTN
jgi:hypothetical protein